MNVSSMYLSRKDSFSDIDPNIISSKYPMYMFANTGDNCELINSSSFCRYMSDFISKVNIYISLSIGTQVHSSREGSAATLSRTIVSR